MTHGRSFLALTLLVLASAAQAQRAAPELGLGFVVVEARTVARGGEALAFFAAPDARRSAFTVRLDTFRQASDPLVWATLVRGGAVQPWEEGKMLAEFGILHLPAYREAHGRVQTEVQGKKAWLDARPGVAIVPWEDYLVRYVTGFDRIEPAKNPLRSAPDASASAVLFAPPEGHGWECLAVAEVRGEWARVRWSELCWARDLPAVDGWIQWRAGSRLLIDYGLVC